MKITTAILFTLIGIVFQINAQTSVGNGDWETGTTWSSGSAISTTTVGSNNQNILVSSADTVQVGSFGNNVGLNFIADKEDYDLYVESDATLIIYGDVTFDNKSMGMVIDGTLIVIGNMTLGNKLEIASDGVLVVSGTFAKNGSSKQGAYTGTGKVYTGAYNGTANDWFTESNASAAQASTSDLTGDGLTAISDFIANNGEFPLPITLAEFNSIQNAENITLNWTTSSEENFDYFEIQRANASMEFETIATVQGNGNSKVAIDYTWTDERPQLGTNYYRLLSNDFDGYQETFKAIFVNFESSRNELSIYPNPANSNSTINILGGVENEVVVNIYNMQGQLSKAFTTDSNYFELNSELEKGMYIVELTTNGLQKRQRLIIR